MPKFFKVYPKAFQQLVSASNLSLGFHVLKTVVNSDVEVKRDLLRILHFLPMLFDEPLELGFELDPQSRQLLATFLRQDVDALLLHLDEPVNDVGVTLTSRFPLCFRISKLVDEMRNANSTSGCKRGASW